MPPALFFEVTSLMASDELDKCMAFQIQLIKSAISLIVSPPHSHFNADKYHIYNILTLYFIIKPIKQAHEKRRLKRFGRLV